MLDARVDGAPFRFASNPNRTVTLQAKLALRISSKSSSAARDSDVGWQKRTVFLFSDCILWCKERKFGEKKLVYKGHLPLDVVLLDKHPLSHSSSLAPAAAIAAAASSVASPSTSPPTLSSSPTNVSALTAVFAAKAEAASATAPPAAATTVPAPAAASGAAALLSSSGTTSLSSSASSAAGASSTTTGLQASSSSASSVAASAASPPPAADFSFQVVRMDQHASFLMFQPTSFTQWYEWTTALEEAIEKYRASDATAHRQAVEAANQSSLQVSMQRAARIARRLIESERDFADDLDMLLNLYWIPMVTSSVIDPAILPDIFGPIERVAMVHVSILESIDKLRNEAAAALPAIEDRPLNSAETEEELELRLEKSLDDRLPASHWLRAAGCVADALLRVDESADHLDSAIELYRMYITTADKRAGNLVQLMATRPTLATFVRAQDALQDAQYKLRLLMRRPCERVLLYAAVCDDLRGCLPIGHELRFKLERVAPLLDDIARPFRRTSRAASAAFAAKQVVIAMLEYENEQDVPSVVAEVVPAQTPVRAISSKTTSSNKHRGGDGLRKRRSRRSVISRVATALKTKPAPAAASSGKSTLPTISPSSSSPSLLQGVPPLSASASSTTVFGKRLSDLSSEGDDAKKSSPRSKNYLPVVVRAAIAEIDRHLQLEPPVFALTGLFREAVSHGKLRAMRARIDAGETVDLRDEESPHFAANLLKLWLRELPSPLLPAPVQERLLAVLAADDETDDATAEAVRVALAKMNAGRRTAVLEIVGLLHRCSQKHEKTRMNAGNIAVVFGPVLLPPPPQSQITEVQAHMARANRVTTRLIELHPLVSKSRPPTTRPPPTPAAVLHTASPPLSPARHSKSSRAALGASPVRRRSDDNVLLSDAESEDEEDEDDGGGDLLDAEYDSGGDARAGSADEAAPKLQEPRRLSGALNNVVSLMASMAAEEKSAVGGTLRGNSNIVSIDSTGEPGGDRVEALQARVAELEARLVAVESARTAAEKDRDQLRSLLITIEKRLSNLEEANEDASH